MTDSPDPAAPRRSRRATAAPERVRNGYALVTLHKDGGFTEAFYETDVAGPVWQRTWAAGETEEEE